MVLTQEVRIGVQFIVQGDRIEIEKLVNLMALFLEIAIPALLALQNAGIVLMAVVGGLQDAFGEIKAIKVLYGLDKEITLMKIWLTFHISLGRALYHDYT